MLYPNELFLISYRPPKYKQLHLIHHNIGKRKILLEACRFAAPKQRNFERHCSFKALSLISAQFYESDPFNRSQQHVTD